MPVFEEKLNPSGKDVQVSINRLSSKPVLYVCNVEEASADKGNEFSARVFNQGVRSTR